MLRLALAVDLTFNLYQVLGLFLACVGVEFFKTVLLSTLRDRKVKQETNTTEHGLVLRVKNKQTKITLSNLYTIYFITYNILSLSEFLCLYSPTICCTLGKY